MKYVVIRFKIYKINEEEFDHYHVDGYPLPINKTDTITLLPKYLGHFSERRHMKNLKKGKRYKSLNVLSELDVASMRANCLLQIKAFREKLEKF